MGGLPGRPAADGGQRLAAGRLHVALPVDDLPPHGAIHASAPWLLLVHSLRCRASAQTHAVQHSCSGQPAGTCATGRQTPHRRWQPSCAGQLAAAATSLSCRLPRPAHPCHVEGDMVRAQDLSVGRISCEPGELFEYSRYASGLHGMPGRAARHPCMRRTRLARCPAGCLRHQTGRQANNWQRALSAGRLRRARSCAGLRCRTWRSCCRPGCWACCSAAGWPRRGRAGQTCCNRCWRRASPRGPCRCALADPVPGLSTVELRADSPLAAKPPAPLHRGTQALG